MSSQYQGPYNGPEGPVSLSERQRIAQEVVGVVEWSEDGSWGYCACPGAALHNGKTARRDCRVFTGLRGTAQESPNVYCLHTSCLSAIEAATGRLRSLVGKAKAAAGRALPPAPSGSPNGVRTASHTARTFKFRVSEEGERSPVVKAASEPTARTEEKRPLTRFTHVRAHTHCATEPAKETSEPYVKKPDGGKPTPAPVAQPARQMTRGSAGVDTPTAATGRVFCPVRLVWITRAEWDAELKANPIKPLPSP
jgi:hypothetical protein